MDPDPRHILKTGSDLILKPDPDPTKSPDSDQSIRIHNPEGINPALFLSIADKESAYNMSTRHSKTS